MYASLPPRDTCPAAHKASIRGNTEGALSQVLCPQTMQMPKRSYVFVLSETIMDYRRLTNYTSIYYCMECTFDHIRLYIYL